MNALLTSIGYQRWILPALLIIPLLGAALIWLQGRGTSAESSLSDEVASGTASSPRSLALITFAIEFIVSLGLWWSFDPANGGWQSVFDVRWIPSWGIRFTLGVDGISV